MKKLLSVMMLVVAAAPFAAAQDKAKTTTDPKAERREMIEQARLLREEKTDGENAVSALTSVGDPDSFGKNAKFLGFGVTGIVLVYRSCDPAILLDELGFVLEPNDRCIAQTFGGPTASGEFNDLGSITLPARSADNLIYFIINNTVLNRYENFGTFPVSTSFVYAPRLTIESAALNDPTAVNPTTGLPLNGVLTVGVGSKFENRFLQVGTFETGNDTYSRASGEGLSRSFFARIGLPPPVIDRLYRQPMTIKLGMRVSARNVAFGQYFYSMRLLGN